MSKLCECGCGQQAPIATKTDRKYGWVKGQPKRFILGHTGKPKGWKKHVPYAGVTLLCECGCGQPAPIAKGTCRRSGAVDGQPQRFVHGHSTVLAVASSVAVNTRHGMTDTPEHVAYRNAKYRCENPLSHAWKDYGGRGIKFLFNSFEEFFACLGSRPKGVLPNGRAAYSLDRWPNQHGNYEPTNVRWATKLEQASNRRPSSAWRQAA